MKTEQRMEGGIGIRPAGGGRENLTGGTNTVWVEDS